MKEAVPKLTEFWQMLKGKSLWVRGAMASVTLDLTKKTL
jgi:hypothetical protein